MKQIIKQLSTNKQLKRILSNKTKIFFLKEKGLFWRFKTSNKEFFDKAFEIYNKENIRSYIG
jgi:hypothetical protein